MAYIIRCFSPVLGYKSNKYRGYKWVLAFLECRELIKNQENNKGRKIRKRGQSEIVYDVRLVN